MDRAKSLARLCRKYKLDILYVFGSRTAEVKSWLAGTLPALVPGPADVDIGVKEKEAEEHPLSVDQKVHLTLDLEDLLGVGRVDLVTFSEADAFLAVNILRGERLYALDTLQADEFDLYILRRAGDLAPFERERMAMIFKEKA